MAAFDFPASPANGAVYSLNGISYVWNGYAWMQATALGAPPSYTKNEADAKFVDVAGDTMTGDFRLAKVEPSLQISKAASGQTSALRFDTNGIPRWQISSNATAESGSNVGSDFTVSRFADNGTFIDGPLSIQRSSGYAIIKSDLWFSQGGTLLMYGIRSTASSWNFYSNAGGTTGMYMAPSGNAWVGISDARQPYKMAATATETVLDRLGGAQLYSNVAPSGKTELFFKAQELATTLPELVHEPEGPYARDDTYQPESFDAANTWGVMYDRCGAVALQAVKELLARIEALEAQLESR